jgi:hypothetical protein
MALVVPYKFRGLFPKLPSRMILPVRVTLNCFAKVANSGNSNMHHLQGDREQIGGSPPNIAIPGIQVNSNRGSGCLPPYLNQSTTTNSSRQNSNVPAVFNLEAAPGEQVGHAMFTNSTPLGSLQPGNGGIGLAALVVVCTPRNLLPAQDPISVLGIIKNTHPTPGR